MLRKAMSMNRKLQFAVLSFIFQAICVANGVKDEPDPAGYIAYCPCMGRFGNQADHFLGALAFAKALNRTLILPPWVEYRTGEMRSYQIPFNRYFKVEPILEYHRVILMEEFMDGIAKKIWPLHKRISFCYMERKSLDPENTKKDCNAKEGNPFGPFWDTFQIKFIASEFFGPLHYDVHHSNVSAEWAEKYPPTEWPVLAFTGAPGSFPVQSENRALHKYIQWTSKYAEWARYYIKNSLPRGASVGIHLRNGIDWVRACQHIKSSSSLFASPQCLGYKNENGELYEELCFPSKEIIVAQLKRLIRKVQLEQPSNPIKSIFVASDSNHMTDELTSGLRSLDVSVHKLDVNHPHFDLAVLGSLNYFVGNCISSYSAFVVREREAKGFPSYFWAFPKSEIGTDIPASEHDEL